MKKERDYGSCKAADRFDLHRLAVRRTTMICEEETVFDYMSNDHMLERLHHYADVFKKHN